MKKILMLMILLLFTGCSAEYSLDIQGNSYSEELNIYGTSIEVEDYVPLINVDSNFDTYYDSKLDKGNIAYNNSSSISNYKKSTLFSSCYTLYNFIEDGENYVLQTSGSFNCYPYQTGDYDYYEYDQLTIKITTNHVVVDNNADEIKDDIYYWYIDGTNYQDHGITFVFSKDELVVDTKSRTQLVVIISIVLTAVIIFGIIMLRKNMNNNKL